MLTIFHAPGSRSQRIVWLSEEMGIPYELKTEQFGQFSPEFLQTNPAGALPAIRDGDVRMGESTAIMQYLMDAHGPTPLARKYGDDRYADYLQFLTFGEASMGAFLNPALFTQFMAPDDQKQNFTVDVAKNMFRNRLKSLDAQLDKGAYMAGDDFTAADISVGYALNLGKGLGLDADYSTKVKAYHDRMQARPAYQAAAAK
jgi:glutathione S-transferase